jgi:hypothetical protein
MFAVDNVGQISRCIDEPPSLPGMERNDPNLVPIACNELVKNFKATSAMDENGQPVQSIQNAQIVFTKR